VKEALSPHGAAPAGNGREPLKQLRLKTQDSRPKKSLILLFILASCVLSLFLPLNSYGDIEKSLKDLEKKQKTIDVWKADFIQTKVTALMTDKIVSEGYAAFKRPNLIRWRYIKGSNLLMVFNGNEAWLYYPNLREAERYRNIERMIKKFPLAYGLEIETIRKYWDISIISDSPNEFITLELRPKEKESRRVFEKITLLIEKKIGVPRKVQIFEPGGDYTIIEFKEIKVNESLPSDFFTFKPPEGIKVITPFEER
jgi:outer membrane lipoprotein carrier protein